jgi:hypothetical protein
VFFLPPLPLHRISGFIKRLAERDTVVLGINQVMQILKNNPQAYAEIKKAKTNMNFSSVLGFAGGVLIGLPLGTALAGGDPEWGLAAGGAGLILASLPLNKAFQNHTLKALEIYNGHPGSRVKSQFRFTGNAVQWVIRF